jgi:hypothetical protein
MKPKHQRLALTLTALVALIGAALLAASALREEASYFYTPTTLAETKPLPRARRCGWAEWCKSRVCQARRRRVVSGVHRTRSES